MRVMRVVRGIRVMRVRVIRVIRVSVGSLGLLGVSGGHVYRLSLGSLFVFPFISLLSSCTKYKETRIIGRGLVPPESQLTLAQDNRGDECF